MEDIHHIFHDGTFQISTNSKKIRRTLYHKWMKHDANSSAAVHFLTCTASRIWVYSGERLCLWRQTLSRLAHWIHIQRIMSLTPTAATGKEHNTKNFSTQKSSHT